MRNLAPNTYADLKEGRRLAIAIPRCKACAPEGFGDAEKQLRKAISDGESVQSVAKALGLTERDVAEILRSGWTHFHNLHSAETGERAYPVKQYRRAA